MIKLILYPPAFGEPTASPFCMKVWCMLAASNLPFEVVELADPRKTPKQKLPVIEAEGTVIADSEIIRNYIETQAGSDFDEGLSAQQRAVSQALIRMVEEHLYFAIVADRWGEDDNWSYVRDVFFSDIPGLLRGIITSFVRKQALRNLQGQGMGRYTKEERFDRVRRDISAIRDVLGEQAFLFGDKPTAADYSVAPMLRASIVTPVEKSLGKLIKNDEKLMTYVTRVTDSCYPVGIK